MQTPRVNWQTDLPKGLSAHTVDIWRTSIDGLAQAAIDWSAYLSSAELARAQRFKFSADQLRYQICHAVLRQLLGHYLGTATFTDPFQIGEYGKPELATHDLQFNLSHTKHWCLIGISQQIVGIDVERVDPTFDGRRLASHYFNATELAQIDAANDENSACETFFSLWTCKEALMKADGRGMQLPLDSFSVTAPLSSFTAVSNQLPYKLQRFQISPTDLGAVATTATTHTTRFFDVRPTLFD